MTVEGRQTPVLKLDSGIYMLVSQKENRVIHRLEAVLRIETEYGKDTSRAWIHAYRDPETLNRFEPKHLLQRSEKKGGSQ